jgi:hypothetical protein
MTESRARDMLPQGHRKAYVDAHGVSILVKGRDDSEADVELM